MTPRDRALVERAGKVMLNRMDEGGYSCGDLARALLSAGLLGGGRKVRLPKEKTYWHYSRNEELARGWDDCLDAVKKLNQGGAK